MIAVFQIPAVPFPESVVTPIPLVFFAQGQQIGQIPFSAGSPANDRKLAHHDPGAVFLLKLAHRRQATPQRFLIPIFPVDIAGVDIDSGQCGDDPLMRIIQRTIHVNVVNDIFERQRMKIGEIPRTAPVICRNADRRFRIDLPDRFRGAVLQLQIINAAGRFLIGLIEKVVPVNRRAIAIAAGNLSP